MPDFNPFDMDRDGDADGIDFLGLDYLMEHVLSPDSSEDERDDLGRDTGYSPRGLRHSVVVGSNTHQDGGWQRDHKVRNAHPSPLAHFPTNARIPLSPRLPARG